MTEKQADTMISILENIEKHLQAIDWKFWDLHQQFGKEKSNVDSTTIEKPVKEEVSVVDDELESLAEIVSTPTVTSVTENLQVKHTLKYPSIEVLK